MSHPAHSTLKAVLALAASAVVAVAIGAAPAAATTPEHLTLSWVGSSVLTLPAGDSFLDTSTLNIMSTHSDSASVSVKRLTGGSGSLSLLPTFPVVPLSLASGGYTGDLSLTANLFNAGTYRITITDDGVSANKTLTVGSGVAHTVKVTPLRKTYFPKSSVEPDEVSAQVVAKDETGTAVPITGGTLTLKTSHHEQGQVSFSSNATTPTATTGDISVSGFHTGNATLVASGVTGATASSHLAKSPAATISLVLVKLTSLKVTDYATLYPNIPGYHNEDPIEVVTKINAPDTVGLTGSITVSKNGEVAQSWPIADSGVQDVTWDGLLDSMTVFGTYTLKVTAHVPGSNTITKTSHIVLSRTVLVQKTVTVTKTARKFINGSSGLTSGESCSFHSDGSISCSTGPAGSISLLGVVAAPNGGIPVPAAVLKFAATRGYSASVSAQLSKLSFLSGGNASLEWNGSGGGTHYELDVLSAGTTKSAKEDLSAASTTIEATLTVHYATFRINKISAKFTYWTLP